MPTRDRDERVTLGAVLQHLYADVAKAGAGDRGERVRYDRAAVEQPLDRHRLRREAAIGEAHDEGRVRPQNPKDFSEHLAGTLQILDGDTAEGSIATSGFQRQSGVRFRSCTKLRLSRGLALSSSAFMPWPITSEKVTSDGRWLTQLDMRSSSTPPAGSVAW